MPANAIEAVGGRLAEAEGALAGLVQGRCWPGKPAANASLPYVVFYRTSGDDGVNLNGRRGTRQHEIRVEAWARSEEEAETVLAAAHEQLDGWQDRSNGVQGCFARGDADEQVNEDDTHVSGQTFGITFCPQ